MNVRRQRTTSIVFATLLAAIAVGGFFVARSAQVAILDSRSGSVSEVILDPAAPGFRAFTDATPTALVAHTSVTPSGSELSGVTILTAADAGIGGSVVSVQATFASEASGPTLTEIFATDGIDAVVENLAAAVGTGFPNVIVLDASSWTSLMREDLPLTLSLRTNLVELVNGVPTVVLPAGTRDFELPDVARVVSHQNPSEPSLGLALRQQEVWRSWISRTAGSEDRPELFDLDTGFSSLIGALASGEVSYRTIPTSTMSASRAQDTRYVGQGDEIQDLFAQIVPFPVEVVPGDRPAVLLLDATGGVLDRNEFVELITRSGGRVAILGNVAGESEAVNRVQLHSAAGNEVAELIAQELDVGEVEDVPLDEATTAVTVIMGTAPASS